MGPVLAGNIIFMRETYATVLLERKAKKLGKATNNADRQASVLFKRAIVRPLRMLFLQPIVLAISLYTATVFGYLFLLFTTFTPVFEETYQFSTSIVGLTYLGLGIGIFIGLLGFSKFSDRYMKMKAASRGGVMKPEDRLILLVYCSPILPIGFFWYGWSAEAHTHWIVPILGTTVIGVGMLCTFVSYPSCFITNNARLTRT